MVKEAWNISSSCYRHEKSGNEPFVTELSKWIFHERGHLKVGPALLCCILISCFNDPCFITMGMVAIHLGCQHRTSQSWGNWWTFHLSYQWWTGNAFLSYSTISWLKLQSKAPACPHSVKLHYRNSPLRSMSGLGLAGSPTWLMMYNCNFSWWALMCWRHLQMIRRYVHDMLLGFSTW